MFFFVLLNYIFLTFCVINLDSRDSAHEKKVSMFWAFFGMPGILNDQSVVPYHMLLHYLFKNLYYFYLQVPKLLFLKHFDGMVITQISSDTVLIF